MGHRGCRLAVTYPEIAKNADKSCYKSCNRMSKKAHPDWNVIAGDYDSAYL